MKIELKEGIKPVHYLIGVLAIIGIALLTYGLMYKNQWAESIGVTLALGTAWYANLIKKKK